jgi:hypothetical protein
MGLELEYNVGQTDILEILGMQHIIASNKEGQDIM